MPEERYRFPFVNKLLSERFGSKREKPLSASGIFLLAFRNIPQFDTFI
jgi:hypothetical protein